MTPAIHQNEIGFRHDFVKLKCFDFQISLNKIYLVGDSTGQKKNYIVIEDDRTPSENCIALRINRVMHVGTMVREMNQVATKNIRCVDPSFCYILAWPKNEHADIDHIFAAAENGIDAIGMSEHQYYITVHNHTKNIYCRVVINRINPSTLKSQHIRWAEKMLHLTCRESEIEFGWSNENGHYIVVEDENNKKHIISNPKFRLK